MLFVRIRHDHHVVLGAGEALHPLHVAGTGFVYVLSDRNRTDKGYGLDGRISQQGINLLFGTVNHLQYTLGCAGLLKQLGQAGWCQRVLLGRFQNKGVAAGNGHGEHPQRDHGREVERRNAGTHPQRLDPGMGIYLAGHVFNGLAHHQGSHVGGVFHHFNAAPDIAFGVVKGLAGFLGQDLGDFVVMFFKQRLITQHHPCSLRNRGFLPAFEHFTGVINRLTHLVGSGAGHLGNHFVGGGVGHVDPVLGLALNEFPCNKLRYFFHDDVPCLLLSGMSRPTDNKADPTMI